MSEKAAHYSALMTEAQYRGWSILFIPILEGEVNTHVQVNTGKDIYVLKPGKTEDPVDSACLALEFILLRHP